MLDYTEGQSAPINLNLNRSPIVSSDTDRGMWGFLALWVSADPAAGELVFLHSYTDTGGDDVTTCPSRERAVAWLSGLKNEVLGEGRHPLPRYGSDGQHEARTVLHDGRSARMVACLEFMRNTDPETGLGEWATVGIYAVTGTEK